VRKSSPLEELGSRVNLLRAQFGSSVFVMSGMTGALSVYQPTEPPRFLFSDVLTQDEMSLAGLHELGHLVLHLPGSTDPNPNETPEEENLVHAASATVCDHFGVGGYAAFVAKYQLPAGELTSDQRFEMLTLATQLRTALVVPHIWPEWAGPKPDIGHS
jgi:hypothetical protein